MEVLYEIFGNGQEKYQKLPQTKNQSNVKQYGNAKPP